MLGVSADPWREPAGGLSRLECGNFRLYPFLAPMPTLGTVFDGAALTTLIVLAGGGALPLTTGLFCANFLLADFL